MTPSASQLRALAAAAAPAADTLDAKVLGALRAVPGSVHTRC